MRNADNKGIAHTKRTLTISHLLAIPLISRPAFREHLNLVEPIGNKVPTAPIRLFVFDDRVEVISPGALAGGLTEEDIRNGKTYQQIGRASCRERV